MDREIAVGYKQTEVGVIPEDWDIRPLSKLTSLMTNGFVGVSKTHYTKNDDDILYIQGYNVKENSFNFNGIKRVTKEFHKKNSKSCLQKGDLLTIQTGDIGLTTIIPEELKNSNCHALIISRFIRKHLEPKYYSYYLNSYQGRARLKEIETGSTMKHINVGDMIHFLVPVPSTKTEQTAIATALSDVDALISGLGKLITKKRLLKQGAMQELLTGKKRLAEFKNEGGDKQTEVGLIPKDWAILPLSKLTSLMTNGFVGIAKIHYTKNDDDILYIQGYNVKENSFNFSGIKRVTKSFHKKNAKSCLQEGDLLTIQTGDIGLTTIIPREIENSNCHALIISRFNKNYSEPKYYSYYLNSHQGRTRLKEIETGSTMKHINVGDMVHFLVPVPPTKTEQTAIAKILSDMDTEIEALENRRTKTLAIKQGMMQELLTGKTRLI